MATNTTHLTNRLMKTRKLTVLVTALTFILLLSVVALSAHSHVKRNSLQSTELDSQKLKKIANAETNAFQDDIPEHELEHEAEMEEQKAQKEQAEKEQTQGGLS